jgi:hypothetical protein
MSITRNHLSRGDAPALGLADEEVVEIPLLLPTWQAAALVTTAQQHGLTVAEMVRRLLGNFLQSFRASRTGVGERDDR